MGALLLYKMGKSTTLAQHNHITTQPQHTTINMSCCQPSSGFGPLPPWVGQQRHQIMAPPLPMGPSMTPAIGCALAAPPFLVWGIETQPIEKQRGGWGLGLRWPLFDYSNQKFVFAVGRMLRRVRDCGGMCGGSVLLLFGGGE